MLSQPVPLGRAFGTPRTTGNAHCRSGLEKPPSRVSVWLWQTPPGERTRSPTTRWPQSNPVEAVKRAADTAVPFRSRDFERKAVPGDKARARARDPAPLLSPARSAHPHQNDCPDKVPRALRGVGYIGLQLQSDLKLLESIIEIPAKGVAFG